MSYYVWMARGCGSRCGRMWVQGGVEPTLRKSSEGWGTHGFVRLEEAVAPALGNASLKWRVPREPSGIFGVANDLLLRYSGR